MKTSSAVQLLLRYFLISEPEKREPSASRLGRFKLPYPTSKVLTEVTLSGPDSRGIGTTIFGLSRQSPSRQPSTLSRLHFSSNFNLLVLSLTTVFQARSYIQFYNKTFAFISYLFNACCIPHLHRMTKRVIMQFIHHSVTCRTFAFFPSYEKPSKSCKIKY